jgi:hypothetical protein
MNVSLSASKIVAWETDMTQAEVGDAAGGEADDVVDAAVVGSDPTIQCRVLNPLWRRGSDGERSSQPVRQMKVRN